jgi:3-carboxy-cis,cis-muconate cycloisomerase
VSSLLRERPATTVAMIAAFDDASTLRAALAFEAALARASAAEGLIDAQAATLIVECCRQLEREMDPEALAEQAAHAGTLAIPLVQQLRSLVAARDARIATLVHHGATSQDLADTVLILQAKAAASLIGQEARGLLQALERLTETHSHTPALGRTLLQAARPITFGLKSAQWLLGIDAALRRFERECHSALCLQLGGPVGTLAGLTIGVLERLAASLDLAAPPLPWHVRRDAIAGLAGALGILTGAAGKLARDISLLAQNEVAEAQEPAIPGRGGSSAMGHKRNPTGCQVALSASLRAPGLVASILSGMPQEHERGLGGWQAEGPSLAVLFELTHGALSAMRMVVTDLQLDTAAMQRNLQQAHVGEDGGHAGALIERALRHYREQR